MNNTKVDSKKAHWYPEIEVRRWLCTCGSDAFNVMHKTGGDMYLQCARCDRKYGWDYPTDIYVL